jgi:hypothetical protein
MDETPILVAICHLEYALRKLREDPPDEDHALLCIAASLRALDRGIRGALEMWAPAQAVPAGGPAVAELDDIG